MYIPYRKRTAKSRRILCSVVSRVLRTREKKTYNTLARVHFRENSARKPARLFNSIAALPMLHIWACFKVVRDEHEHETIQKPTQNTHTAVSPRQYGDVDVHGLTQLAGLAWASLAGWNAQKWSALAITMSAASR